MWMDVGMSHNIQHNERDVQLDTYNAISIFVITVWDHVQHK